MTHLILEGGAEFGGRMSEPDMRGIELAGGFDAPICVLPTAAALDNNHKRAGNNGVRWFNSLGAKNVFVAEALDKKSANDAGIADQIRNSKLIYILGGFPGYLGETLKDSLCWSAALAALESGAVIAGSSAGAMVLCEYYYDPLPSAALIGIDEGTGLVGEPAGEWRVYGGGKVTLHRSGSAVGYGRGEAFRLR
ncbi:MAG: Type 1 glutamine amidotransferase-like domain-containing protein [Anaerolineales bacterium]|nr:Type 1 glutamine amidotransferase-like domain-containing protein [Anaerolineales bacterium]